MLGKIDPIMKWVIECGTRTVGPNRLKYPAAVNTIGLVSEQPNLNLILAIAKRTPRVEEQELGHSAILINRRFESMSIGIIRNRQTEPNSDLSSDIENESTTVAASQLGGNFKKVCW